MPKLSAKASVTPALGDKLPLVDVSGSDAIRLATIREIIDLTAPPIDAAARASVGSGDLFLGTSLDGGWSDLQTTPVTTVDRSIDGHLVLENTGNTTGKSRGIKRAFAPAGDFTVYCKILSSTFGITNIWPGMFVGKSDPSDGGSGDRLELNLYSNTDGTQSLQFIKYTAGAGAGVFDRLTDATTMGAAMRYKYGHPFPVWLRIKRVGSTLTAGVSWDGVKWHDQATTTTISFTVATIGLYIAEATATQDIRGVFKYIATTG